MLTWTALVVDGRAATVAQVKLLGHKEQPMTTVLWGTTVAAIVVYMRQFLPPLHTIQSDES